MYYFASKPPPPTARYCTRNWRAQQRRKVDVAVRRRAAEPGTGLFALSPHLNAQHTCTAQRPRSPPRSPFITNRAPCAAPRTPPPPPLTRDAPRVSAAWRPRNSPVPSPILCWSRAVRRPCSAWSAVARAGRAASRLPRPPTAGPPSRTAPPFAHYAQCAARRALPPHGASAPRPFPAEYAP